MKIEIVELSKLKHQVPSLERAWRGGFNAGALIVYERLSLMVADYFTVEVILRVQRSGGTHLGPELAANRFYAKNKSQWLIDASIAKRLTG